jgi:hypothetical protein
MVFETERWRDWRGRYVVSKSAASTWQGMRRRRLMFHLQEVPDPMKPVWTLHGRRRHFKVPPPDQFATRMDLPSKSDRCDTTNSCLPR